MTDDEAQRILAEAHETLSRPFASAQGCDERREAPNSLSEAPPVEHSIEHLLPSGTRNQRDAREVGEMHEGFARERRARKQAEKRELMAMRGPTDADRRLQDLETEAAFLRKALTEERDRRAEVEAEMAKATRTTNTLIDALNHELRAVTAKLYDHGNKRVGPSICRRYGVLTDLFACSDLSSHTDLFSRKSGA
jgi:uncharacterized coiled-coil protein SlyX